MRKVTCSGIGRVHAPRERCATPARAPRGLRPAPTRLPPQVRNSRPSWRGRRRRAGCDDADILIAHILLRRPGNAKGFLLKARSRGGGVSMMAVAWAGDPAAPGGR